MWRMQLVKLHAGFAKRALAPILMVCTVLFFFFLLSDSKSSLRILVISLYYNNSMHDAYNNSMHTSVLCNWIVQTNLVFLHICSFDWAYRRVSKGYCIWSSFMNSRLHSLPFLTMEISLWLQILWMDWWMWTRECTGWGRCIEILKVWLCGLWV